MKKTKRSYIIEMEKICEPNYDPEGAHEEADRILCEALKDLGMKKLVTIFDKIVKWYA